MISVVGTKSTTIDGGLGEGCRSLNTAWRTRGRESLDLDLACGLRLRNWPSTRGETDEAIISVADGPSEDGRRSSTGASLEKTEMSGLPPATSAERSLIATNIALRKMTAIVASPPLKISERWNHESRCGAGRTNISSSTDAIFSGRSQRAKGLRISTSPVGYSETGGGGVVTIGSVLLKKSSRLSCGFSMNLRRPAASFGELITLDYCNGWTTFKSRVFAVGFRANFSEMLERIIDRSIDYGFGET